MAPQMGDWVEVYGKDKFPTSLDRDAQYESEPIRGGCLATAGDAFLCPRGTTSAAITLSRPAAIGRRESGAWARQ